MKTGYYPGCSLTGTAREFDMSVRAIAPFLNIELAELPDWNCCGATSAHAINEKLSLALPGRVLAIAEREGLDRILVPCAECYSRLQRVRIQAQESPDVCKRISEHIEMPFSGKVQVLSLPELLAQIGMDKIKAAVKYPLSHIKAASYYGCLLLRPPKIVRFDDCEAPASLDNIAIAAGAQAVDWFFKTECCGASFSLSQTGVVIDLSAKIIRNAQASGANVIVVSCPMCHSNLDMRQVDIMKKTGERLNMPVLYVSELLGLAFGLPPEKLGIPLHFINAAHLLAAQEAQA